jgi:hypothetical protein
MREQPMNDSAREPAQLIEETLAQRPLAALPAGVVERVMAAVQNAPEPIAPEAIRYKIELFDVVLSILFACLVVLALGLTGQLAFLEMVIPIQIPAVFPTTNLSPPAAWAASNWMVLVVLFAFVEIGLGMLLCTWMWLDQPLSLGDIREA